MAKLGEICQNSISGERDVILSWLIVSLYWNVHFLFSISYILSKHERSILFRVKIKISQNQPILHVSRTGYSMKLVNSRMMGKHFFGKPWQGEVNLS